MLSVGIGVLGTTPKGLVKGGGLEDLKIGERAETIQTSQEKYSIFIMKSGKGETNQETIRTLAEKENYKYLGIFEVDTIKKAEMKEKKTRKE